MKKYIIPALLSFLIVISSCDNSTHIKTYTVTFDTDGGTSIRSQSVKAGDLAIRPLNPEKANTKGFKYWSYSISNKTQIFDFETPITSDINLKANYWLDLNNQSGETDDKEIQALKNEVGNLFHIIKDLKELPELMKGESDITKAFDIKSSKSDAVLDVFARLGGNHEYIYDDNGRDYNIGDAKFFYEIEAKGSEIKTNSSTSKAIDATYGITEYDMAIEGLKLTLRVRMNEDNPYEAFLTRTFDITATLYDYGSGQIEVSAKCRINGTELPMLYAIYEKSVAHGSSSESHLYFTYKGYTGNILIDNY